jgi:hypothetical protein
MSPDGGENDAAARYSKLIQEKCDARPVHKVCENSRKAANVNSQGREPLVSMAINS